MLHKDLTETIIGAFYKVYNTLGFDFLEKVYENAMMIELEKQGLNCVQQSPINVYYEYKEVGLLLNFGKEPQFVRKIFSNDTKQI